MRRILFLLALALMGLSNSHGEVRSPLRIMSYNIRIGIGMDLQTDLRRIAEVINRIRPDYVGLQEVDSVCERSGRVNQYVELAKLTGMHPVFAPATERSGGLYGIAALSREKPSGYRYIPLPGKEEPRVFLCLEYPDYILCNTHFSLDRESRLASIRLIGEAMGSADKPVIITGDFNMTPSSEEFEAMNQAWRLLSDPSLATFPSNRPRVRLDYIFGDRKREFNVLSSKVIDVQSSDHLPIYIDVSF